jgi:hypothetical protein
MGVDVDRLWDDVQTSISLDGASCRSLAEDFCSVDRFIDRLFEELLAVTTAELMTTTVS